MKDQKQILARAWMFLTVAAFVSLVVAVLARMWPMALIQDLITAATGFMAYARWKEL